MRYAGILLAVFMTSGVYAADPEFHKIDSCMRSSVPQTLQVDEFSIEATDKSGATRSLDGKFYAKRENDRMRVMLHITSPATVAGASYLVVERKDSSEDDMYVFLPSLNRSRHVTGAFANGSLLGTDFSYAEVKQIVNAFSGSDGSFVGAEKIDGRDVNVITLKPLAVTKSPYSSVKAWVDKESCFVLKAEFNVGKVVRKRMTVPTNGISQSGKYWYLSQLEMEDLKQGTRTVMHLRGADSSKAIPTTYFNSATFYIGH